MSRRALLFALVVASTACDSTPLSMSCGGAPVLVCDPYEYAEPTTASLEPSALPVAAFSRTAHIVVTLARCADAPAPHAVELSVLTSSGDGGALRVTSLLTLEDGADGDVPGDDRIEVDVANPFIATVPEDSDVTLRFTARSSTPGGCAGGAIEVPYHTGPRRAP